MSEWTETYKGHEVKVRKLANPPRSDAGYTRYRLVIDGRIVTQDWPAWARVEKLVPCVVAQVCKEAKP
jgi:hypothetical protein